MVFWRISKKWNFRNYFSVIYQNTTVAVAIAVFVELNAVWEKINPYFVAMKENFMGKREDETEKASEGQ